MTPAEFTALADRLTDKQKHFAQLIADGKTNYEAYTSAYDVNTTRRNSIDSLASRERAKPDVAAYIAELIRRKQEKAVHTAFMTDERKRAIIQERIEYCIQTNNDSAIRGYLDVLNRMDGVYVQQTRDLTEDKDKLSDLSTEELKKIIEFPSATA